MMTPRKPVAGHAREPIELSRDAALEIIGEYLTAIELVRYAAEGEEESGWRVLAAVMGRMGRIATVAGFQVRELESIEGIMRAVDSNIVDLIEERDRRVAK